MFYDRVIYNLGKEVFCSNILENKDFTYVIIYIIGKFGFYFIEWEVFWMFIIGFLYGSGL